MNAIKLTAADLGKRFRCRNGVIVKLTRMPKRDWFWGAYENSPGPEGDGYNSFDLNGRCAMGMFEGNWDIVSKVRAPKRKHRPSTSIKRRKTPVKRTPNKYFIGKMEKVKRGSPYRIFRRRKTLLGHVDEICMRYGWKRIKKGYSKVGIFLDSQAQVRAAKRVFEGRA